MSVEVGLRVGLEGDPISTVETIRDTVSSIEESPEAVQSSSTGSGTGYDETTRQMARNNPHRSITSTLSKACLIFLTVKWKIL
jgi:hypothetical protein